MVRPGDLILLCVLALLTLGVIMVSSAGMAVAEAAGSTVTVQSIVFSRSTAYAALALLALAAAAFLPVRRIAASYRTTWWIPLLWPAALALLLLVYLPGLGHAVNGAHRWILLPGGLTIQPSEVAKWATVVLIAWYAWKHAGSLDRFVPGLLPALVILGSITVVIVKEDLGTGALIAATGTIILLAGGARVAHFMMLAPVFLVGLLAALVASPYRLQRIAAYIDPYADPDGTGYHIIQSLVAIANGGGFGRGLGFGLQKFGYLPEDRTDFLFSVVCEELGIAGALLVIALYATLILAGAAIVRRESNTLLKLIGLGVTTTLALQTLINLFVVTGLAPTKGIALPLMSSGGTGWILTAASLGLLIAMDRAQRHDAPTAEPSPQPAPASTEAIAEPLRA